MINSADNALNTIEILALLLTMVGALVLLKILMLLLPMVSVRKISDEQRRKGFECFYVRFKFPNRKKAVMCFSQDRMNFYLVSAFGKSTDQPFIALLKSEIENMQKISAKKIYKYPFKGNDLRFKPPREEVKFSYSGKPYAFTFFGKYEKLNDLIENKNAKPLE